MKSNNKSIMKKYFIIAATAIVAMAACSKVETVDTYSPSAISFSVVNHLQQTKATAGLTYPTSVPFGSFAWWTQNVWESTTDKQNFVFMDNQEVAYNSTDKEWAPTIPFYWTKTGYITFASYSPYTENGSDKGYSAVPEYDVTKGFLFTDYTIVDGTDIDLMYANLAADCTKNTNTNGVEVTDDNNPESGFKGVPTIFNHALCQIGFEFRAIGRMNPNVDSIKVVLKDVDIKNIDKKGSFTQIPASGAKWASDHTVLADYDYAPVDGTDYDSSTGAEGVELVLLDGTNAAVVAADTNYTALSTTRILLPQALEADPADPTSDPIVSTTDQKLVVNYVVMIKYHSAPTVWATEEVTSEVRLNNGNITAWRDNQNITYRISINPYSTVPVTFDPAVVDWTDVFSTDINLNQFDDE